ncbi:MAG: rRNA maturation RNase YbeY [Bacteroidales bacterium]|nr:rRNA maturation RNase YbeY [Bacteroidales bacterium]MDY0215407.1 rRNA maturation RNase YbeY [Bacteroidales bacterium]
MPNNIQFISQDVAFQLKEKRKIKKWLTDLINSHQKRVGEISIVFSNNDYVLEINKQFLSHDFYTDIITFNYNEDDFISGDLIISIDMVRENAEKYRETFERELHRVVVHGILHLLGLNDETKTEEAAMRIAENNALKML